MNSSFTDRLIDILGRPVPLRVLVMRRALRRFPIGSYMARLSAGAVERPWYGWCLYQAALQAKLLGHRAVTAIECGVAGGNGLVCLCNHRDEIAEILDIEIRLKGFDTGAGLPPSQDARDLLYCWPTGSFEMDKPALERRIAGRAELVLGDVSQTVASSGGSAEAPIGAVIFDLDYYSSTRSALPLLAMPHTLPRIWCYMDDICGAAENAYSDSIGVRAAIKEFNRQQERQLLNDHLSQAFCFKGRWPEDWHEQIYIYHRLNHPDYNRCLSESKHQLRLQM